MPRHASSAGTEKACQVGPSRSQDDELPRNRCLIPSLRNKRQEGSRLEKGKKLRSGAVGACRRGSEVPTQEGHRV